ncbi:MAG: cache domain-containing protein [SAR324 cluster bacterium]|nr:cache domain-containing protein [SAR324 cluster bacterium]
MVFKKLLLMVVLATVSLIGFSVHAADRDGEISVFADKAISHIKKVGSEQAHQDFADRDGDFIKGEVYVVILNLDGIAISHPINPRLIGKNFLKFRDTDGRLFIQEITDNLKKEGVTWVEYTWVNPITKKVAKKRAVAKMIDDQEYVLIGYWP